MRLFDALTAQRRFIYLAVSLLSIAGLWQATRLPSAIYPELKFPRIMIVAEGASLGARQMVFAVTRPIEEAVSIVPGVVRVHSRSIRGESEISIYFSPNTDMQFALQQVQARVNQAQSDLPAGLSIEVERLTPSLFPVLSYNLEGGDPATLYDIARYQVKPVLSRIPGVGRVEVQGTDVREVEVVADPARLAAQGMGYEDLATAIKDAIAVAAVGRVSQDYKQYLVVTDQEAHAVEDVAGVVLPNGLRVRDVATVTLGTEDHVRIIAGDGKPAALLNITRQVGGNTLAIADSITRAVATLAPHLPPGVRITPLYDQATLVREAVASVRDAMLIGAALAVLVLLAFLGHARITAVSASAIPLTMAITVFVMGLVGQTFNLMTLGAMAIAIGLVIDDAVVITENIARHLVLAPDRGIAVREAVQELIWPVTSSTITTVVVFLPLGLLEGVVGQFFTALSITLTIAVLVSLFLALTVIPLLSAQFLTAHDVEKAQRANSVLARITRALEALSLWYERTLARVLPRPRMVAIAALVLIVAGLVAQRLVGTAFLPEMDEGAFVLDYWTPGGTSLAESDRMVHEAERILAGIPEVDGTSRRLGAELGLFATEQNRGDLVVRLKPRAQRDRTSFEVIDTARVLIDQAVPRMRIEFVQILSDVINDLAGAAKPVEIKLFGEQLEQLETYATMLAPKIGAVDGVEDLYSGVSEPAAEMKLKVRAGEAARVGLDPEQVGAAVSGALPIVAAGAHRAVPLSSLATVTPSETRAQLERENQQQMIAITSDVSGRALGSVMRDVRGVLAANPPPAGIRVEIGGQYANQQEAFRALLIVLALAAVSVVAVMVIQFQSFLEPLAIVLAAPVSFVGAVVLLLVTGTPLNVSSLMGLILLVGLIVKNGIILLDFTRRRMRLDGVPLERAIQDAARVRLRPILMTTLCTLFGLLPLALGLGAGAELQRPLALAVIGGLALSTPITLYMVPTIIVAVRRRIPTGA